MIEIIKPGTKTQVTCACCGCVYTYEAEDIQRQSFSTLVPTYKEYVECPQCGRKYYITATRSSVDFTKECEEVWEKGMKNNE